MKQNKQVFARVWWFFKKSKIELPCDWAFALRCMYAKESKAGSERYFHTQVYCSIIHDSQDSLIVHGQMNR